MAFDGTTIAALVKELQDKLINGRLFKIAQPESDELLFTIKNYKDQYKLLISVSASLPLIYITETNKISPMTAPNFCMRLRKHINNGKIISIEQPGLERIIKFEIEHYNDLGDLCNKSIIVELMGKYSNIIFCDEDNIIDSIKHISSSVSSVREVLPGRKYFIPNTTNKLNPLELNYDKFTAHISSCSQNVSKALYMSFTGISPIAAEEVCFRAGIDSRTPIADLSDNELVHIYNTFALFLDDISKYNFSPTIYIENDEPKEFTTVPYDLYSDLKSVKYDTISSMLENFYAQKNIITRIRQKSTDIRRIVQTALEKNRKKYDLQLKQLNDTEKREKFKVYGELITTYGYNLESGAKELKALNYYTNEEIVIPLDPELSPIDNAKKYFDKYSKLKRTAKALDEIIITTKYDIDHLDSIAASLDIASDENTLKEIKEELMQYGYIKKRRVGNKKEKFVSKPFHYISSDGYHIYVGKNNFQNEDITFNLATGNDWWFHAKGIPGSHVIVKSNNEELPDRTFEEAAALAAYYSKGQSQDKVEIDYIQRKHVKKVTGGKPGFVIYHTNYSMAIEPRVNINIVN